MSHEIDGLPAPLLDSLRPGRARLEPGLGIMVCSVDEQGWPHPMMLSPLEIVALDQATLRVATYPDSRSTRFLTATGHVTLMFVEAGSAVYVKGTARRLAAPPGFPHLARFAVHAVTVLQDAADAQQEGAAAIVSGIRVDRSHVEEHEARALLNALSD